MRTVKSHLAAIVAAAALPGLVLGLWASWRLAEEMGAKAEQTGERVAAAMAANIGEHVGLVATALKVLARSPSLHDGDLATTYAFAAQLAADLGQNIGVATADGTQLFNTRRAFGSELPRRAHAASYTRAFDTGQPSVSNVIVGAIARRPLFTIDVPVPETPFGPVVLGTSSDVTIVTDILRRTKLDEDWNGTVVDGEGKVLARTSGVDDAGTLARQSIVDIVKAGLSSGVIDDRVGREREVVSFFRGVPGTAWTVYVDVPRTILNAPFKRSLTWLLPAGAAVLFLTMLLAYRLARRIHRSAVGLEAAVNALARDEEPQRTQAVAEFDRVSEVLVQVATNLRDRRAGLTAALAALREARDQAERAAMEARRAASSKARFFAAASHDLRQPLQAMMLFLDVLRPTLREPKQQTLLTNVERAQRSAAELLNALLDVAKLDAGIVTPSLVTVDVDRLVGDVTAECRPQASAKGLSIRVRPCRRHVVSDPLMLGRILRNLILNAIRYTDRGGILIACRCRGDHLRLEVWDTGHGIASDQRELVWEEFYQVGNSERDSAKGLGLGLSIVQRLANLLGCEVAVKSRLGRGSVFTVWLPLTAAGDDPSG